MTYKSLFLSPIALSLLYVGLAAENTTSSLSKEEPIGLVISADALYLKGSTPADIVGVENASALSDTPIGNALILTSHMNWGSDLSLGYQFGHNKIAEVATNWLHINSNWSQGPVTKSCITPQYADEDYVDKVSSLKSSSHITLNYYDVTLARSITPFATLGFKLYTGLAGLTIKQNFNQEQNGVSLSSPFNYTSKSSKRGIGMLFGNAFDWKWGWGFSLIGDVKFAYLFNNLSISDVRLDPSAGSIGESESTFTSSTKEQSYYVDLKLGVQWMNEWYRGKLKTGLGTGWKMSQFQNGWNIGSSTSDDLGFQGLYLNGYIGF